MYTRRLGNLANIFRQMINFDIKKTYLFCQELPVKSDRDNNYEYFKKILNATGLEILGNGHSECGLIYLKNNQPDLVEIVIPKEKRYSVYYSQNGHDIYVYVNIHVLYNADFNQEISNIINAIKNTREIQRKGTIKKYFFIGDMNKSLKFQKIKITDEKQQELNYKIQLYTTQNNEGYSFKDNTGNMVKHNVDYLMEVRVYPVGMEGTHDSNSLF